MNLILDIGNTRTKLAVFKVNDLILFENCKTKKLKKKIRKILKKFPIKKGIISSVAENNKKIISLLQDKIPLLVLDYQTPIPFTNKYTTPKTLGVDRIALVTAAVKEFPNKNVLIIDAGTCITYDYVSKNKNYFGGAIAPGIKMRYKAMHQFTKKLPLLEPKLNITKGNSTENAMHLGVINGVFLEIEGIISKYKSKNDNLTIVLTGGDTNFLSSLLKSSIFANPNFLVKGLNYILNYNLND